MNYAIIQVTDGSYSLKSEHETLKAAEVRFHTLAASLYNDSSYENCMMKIMDENLDTVEKIFIHNEKTPAQTPTQTQEQTPVQTQGE